MTKFLQVAKFSPELIFPRLLFYPEFFFPDKVYVHVEIEGALLEVGAWDLI